MIELTEQNIESSTGDKFTIKDRNTRTPQISSGSKLTLSSHLPQSSQLKKTTMANLTKLEEHLASRSYIEG